MQERQELQIKQRKEVLSLLIWEVNQERYQFQKHKETDKLIKNIQLAYRKMYEMILLSNEIKKIYDNLKLREQKA